MSANALNLKEEAVGARSARSNRVFDVARGGRGIGLARKYFAL
jgi:hypothetical protein